jgi:hypothetical protein
MDWDNFDYTPIQKSTPTMRIMIRVYKNQFRDSKTVYLPVCTNSTIKHAASYNIDIDRMRYDSHSHHCNMCGQNPKTISKNNTNFKRYYVKQEIKNGADID